MEAIQTKKPDAIITGMFFPKPMCKKHSANIRALAQLVARVVRDDEAVGSSPACPTMKITTNSQQETELLGKKISAKLKGGDILLLFGDLGAGKTSLVKGIAKGLGIKNEITSPTFTLMNIYEVQSLKSKVKSLVHIDTYRLKDEKELLEIGVEDYLGKSDTVCIIEWPEKITNLLKGKKNIAITLEHGDKPNQRKLTSPYPPLKKGGNQQTPSF